MILKYTLIADGSSDKALMNIIKWVFDDRFPNLPTIGSFADFRQISKRPKAGNIQERVNCAKEYYPYDILFYHRDSELTTKNILETRVEEIKGALYQNDAEGLVCIIPVCMMESWLLFDEMAIKKAAGNRNYPNSLDLPNVRNIEKFKTPKDKLHELLKEASGLKNRGLKNFNVNRAVHFVAENIKDYQPLRVLDSFNTFENSLIHSVEAFLK